MENSTLTSMFLLPAHVCRSILLARARCPGRVTGLQGSALGYEGYIAAVCQAAAKEAEWQSQKEAWLGLQPASLARRARFAPLLMFCKVHSGHFRPVLVCLAFLPPT